MAHRRIGKGYAWLWLSMLVVGACSHAPAPIPAGPVQDYAFRQTQAGVRVALDPFFSEERTRAAFAGGEEFPGKGLLPVQVVIENGSPDAIQVSSENFRLVRRDGRDEQALSPNNAFQMVKLPWGWWAVVPVLGMAPSAYRNELRLKDIESKALQDATIPADRTATGFVYFVIPEHETDLAGRRMVFSLTGPAGREIRYDVPITGSRTVPSPVPRSETAGPPAPSPAPTGAAGPQGITRIEGYGGKGVIIRSPAQ